MVKALEALLARAEHLLAPWLRRHVHLAIQRLVQRDLTPLLHRLDKRNKPILPALLKARTTLTYSTLTYHDLAAVPGCGLAERRGAPQGLPRLQPQTAAPRPRAPC